MNKFLNWIHCLARDIAPLRPCRSPSERGTVIIAIVFQGTLANASHVVDVSATATADVTATIPHSLGATPAEVGFEPLGSQSYVSRWVVNRTLTNTTNAVLIKLSVAASDLATRQLRVHIKRPHTKTQ